MKKGDEEDEIRVIKQVFAAIAHEKRKQNKITQERLSEVVGITDVYLRCIESGKNAPNWIVWLKICTALGVDISEIQQKYIVPNLKKNGTLSGVTRLDET